MAIKCDFDVELDDEIMEEFIDANKTIEDLYRLVVQLIAAKPGP